MIDWNKTTKKFGYSCVIDFDGKKRPKVVCACDQCGKNRDITIRVKSRIVNEQMNWLCPSCVGFVRSDDISKVMLRNWSDEQYKKNQLDIKASLEYLQKQSEASVQRWNNPNYRNRIAVGINVKEFIFRSREQFGQQFDYSTTEFGNWQDRIDIICNNCQSKLNAHPQKHIEHGFCPKCGASRGHREISQFLDSHHITHTLNDRTKLPNKELDIFIPDHNLAVEYHGVYWHSHNEPETKEQRHRHQQKALLSLEHNITLLQFFDYEWEHNQKIVKSMILHKIQKSTNIGARELTLRSVSNAQTRPFFEANHLQGHRNAKHTLALLQGDEPISVASFSHYKDGFEIIRYATKVGVHVSGGASKLIKNFVRLHPQPLYTFADLRYSTGDVYLKIGFKELTVTPPGYFYTRQLGRRKYQVLSRQQCQKHKLGKLLGENFDPTTSEAKNMFNNGYRRMWTAGNKKFLLIA